jgi:hypothetical protein
LALTRQALRTTNFCQPRIHHRRVHQPFLVARLFGLHRRRSTCALKWSTSTAAAINSSRRRHVPMAEPVDAKASTKKWWLTTRNAIVAPDSKSSLVPRPSSVCRANPWTDHASRGPQLPAGSHYPSFFFIVLRICIEFSRDHGS